MKIKTKSRGSRSSGGRGSAEPAKFDIKTESFLLAKTAVFTIVFVCLLSVMLFRLSPVVGHSMNPTLVEGDQLITTNLHSTIKRGDIVVIRRAGDESLVKRVIAVEGDVIDIDFDKNEVILNDKVLDEPYINEPTAAREDFSGPVTVPKGHVFVMGDNRNHSDDSRHKAVGMIDTRNIFGKVVFRIFPLNKMGFI